MTENVVQKLYRSISDKVKMNSRKGVYNVIRSHTMRKYFDTTLHNAGVDDFFIQYLEGHDIGETKTGYFKPNPEGVRQRYIEIMHHLAIQKQFDPADSQEFRQMQQENERLARITAKTAIERDEIEDLRTQLDVERAERGQYESNVNGMIDHVVEQRMKEFREKMEAGFNVMIEQMSKNLKEKPLDIS